MYTVNANGVKHDVSIENLNIPTINPPTINPPPMNTQKVPGQISIPEDFDVTKGKNKYILIGSIVGVLVLAALAGWYYRSKKQQRKLAQHSFY